MPSSPSGTNPFSEFECINPNFVIGSPSLIGIHFINFVCDASLRRRRSTGTKKEMASLSTWLRYIVHKIEYSISLSSKNYQIGQITDKQVNENVWKNVFQGKLTYVHFNKGEEMSPTLSGQGGTLLVRRLPTADPKKVFVGDVVALKDPQNPDNCIVRRLAAVEGDEMVSTDEKDEPFVLENDQCWVVSDNESLSPKVLEAADSRLFGPVPMSDILGRVIYCLRSSVDHGPIRNSELAMQKDSPVLAVELDIDEMARSPKT